MKWHDPLEATQDQADDTEGFHDALSIHDDVHDDFGPKITTDELQQSHPSRRKHLQRNRANLHLLTASSVLALASMSVGPAAGMTVIDSGRHTLGIAASTNSFATPFDPLDAHHVLETSLDDCPDNNLHHAHRVNQMHMQYFDHMHDLADGDDHHMPVGIVAHKVTNVQVHSLLTNKTATDPSPPSMQLKTERQL